MESFMESLNRLKDIHEKEVLGLQNKLLELNSERCRDAQRMEELFAKNQQLREQQKALKENVRVLENRLRAGLCDRCMVTQELARKKQQEFESSHLQSLQHVFLLTTEVTRLKEENKSLKEEVKQLQGLEDRPKPLSREGAMDPPLPLLLLSPGGQKASTEKSPQGHKEHEAERPGTDPRGEEQPLGYRTSPVTRISPGANLPEPQAPDLSPQRISNQLHGTIAVVRPGSRVCPADHGSINGTPPRATRSSPPSPDYEPSLPLDSLLRASRPPAMAFEALKRSLQADRLGLLSHHLALHLHSPRSSPLTPTTAPGGPRPRSLKAVETEGWEEPTGLLGLPGTLVDVRDPRLEGTLHLLLAQQQLRVRVGSARPKGMPVPGGMPPSPPTGSDSEGPEDVKVAGAALTTAARHGEWRPRPTDPGSPRGEAAMAAQEYAPDKPLDLSDRGRSRTTPKPACRPGSLSPPTTRTPSPESPQGAEPPAQSGPPTPSPQAISSGAKGSRTPESEESQAPAVEGRMNSEGGLGSLPARRGLMLMATQVGMSPAQGHGGLAGRDPEMELGARVGAPPSTHCEGKNIFRIRAEGSSHCSQSHHAPRPPPGLTGTLYPAESSKAEAQRPESDGLDEPDTSDSEKAPSSEAEAKPSTQGDGPRCFCDKELGQGLQRKRKRPSDPRGKVSGQASPFTCGIRFPHLSKGPILELLGGFSIITRRAPRTAIIPIFSITITVMPTAVLDVATVLSTRSGVSRQASPTATPALKAAQQHSRGTALVVSEKGPDTCRAPTVQAACPRLSTRQCPCASPVEGEGAVVPAFGLHDPPARKPQAGVCGGALVTQMSLLKARGVGGASKKSSRGKRKPQEPLAVAGGPGSLQDAEDSSPSPSSRGWEET
ncbi:RBBP8 N-terminal-like protein [Trichechus manatus latirostris]|uniref:RBBP8 N-terminal-like protein n=1 Tax=Trichechus manatus latirostris TaxID=127582 RepID=A0A2Y9DAS4_TRIMA|nr:RBBP8 N-terminal-like protein [Trichechus manatus latirostris]